MKKRKKITQALSIIDVLINNRSIVLNFTSLILSPFSPVIKIEAYRVIIYRLFWGLHKHIALDICNFVKDFILSVILI
jgi:hypothetical protein